MAARQQGFYQTFKELKQPTICSQLTLSKYDLSRGLLPGTISKNFLKAEDGRIGLHVARLPSKSRGFSNSCHNFVRFLSQNPRTYSATSSAKGHYNPQLPQIMD